VEDGDRILAPSQKRAAIPMKVEDVFAAEFDRLKIKNPFANSQQQPCAANRI
jgi:hypothetical protein